MASEEQWMPMNRNITMDAKLIQSRRRGSSRAYHFPHFFLAAWSLISQLMFKSSDPWNFKSSIFSFYESSTLGCFKSSRGSGNSCIFIFLGFTYKVSQEWITSTVPCHTDTEQCELCEVVSWVINLYKLVSFIWAELRHLVLWDIWAGIMSYLSWYHVLSELCDCELVP